MEEFIQFSAKTKNGSNHQGVHRIMVFPVISWKIEVVSEGSSGLFWHWKQTGNHKSTQDLYSSEEDEIQEIVDTVKVDAIKEEQTRKPAKTL